MPADNRFTLNAEQQERLLACRAVWEEGEEEERLEKLRRSEEDRETLQAIRELLQESGFAQGTDLNYAQMARLLALVRALAPNPNLDARLLRQPGEPEALNPDLRELLFGKTGVAGRVRTFLTRRRAGGQTAMQLLCAAFPTEWPLLTPAGSRVLELTGEQRRTALAMARQRFDLPEERREEGRRKAKGERRIPNTQHPTPGVPDSDPVLRLLAEVVVYTEVREVLEARDYVQTHRMLTLGAVSVSRRRRRSLAPLLYPPPSSRSTLPMTVQESAAEGEPSPVYPAPEAALLPSASPTDISSLSTGDLLAWLERSIAAQGFTYPSLAIRDYYISLQSKPFVILSGLTGTGKTRLTSLFAEALTGEANTQYRLLPVRPDWADSTPLLGYVNLLAGGSEGRGLFVSTPFLDFLRRASQPENGYRAFFLCLDEMNLARVEHYFAEVLSAMETPTRELLLPDGRALRLPANLFLIGTLNLDEATHSLSRKVLDRANVIAFHEVLLREVETETRAGEPLPECPMSAAERQALFLQRRVTTAASARTRLREIGGKQGDLALRVVNTLAAANEILQPYGFHFAYRVRDEALRYCANSFDRDGRGLLVPETPEDRTANLQVALDLQLLQKVAPRLSGTREPLETPLSDLLRWAEKSGFPQTARKLARLLARLQRDGFVSFDEN